MALSFSRPDVSSPASIADATFSTTRRGFDPDEVRQLLRQVAAELGRLAERERFLQHELRTARETALDPDEILDEETVSRVLGEETLRVLQTARESANQIRTRAEESAARIIREASDEAARIRSEAESDAARIRTDASADAEAELSLAKQQGREMVNEARAYRERVLSELARRRDAARQQIEQLASGRDRLVQVFERARLVAVDVVSELAPLGEPDEYVDLSPTTGPVPLMVPATARSEAARPAPESAHESHAASRDEVEDPDATTELAVSSTDEAVEELHDTVDEPVNTVDEAVEELHDTVDEPVGTVDEPEPAIEPEAGPENGPSTEPEAAPELEIEPGPEPEGNAEPGDAPPAGQGTGSNVVDLFARLRAEVADEPADAPAPESAVAEAAGTEAVTEATGTEAVAEATGTEAVVAEPARDEPATDEPAADPAPDDADDGETIFQRRDAELVPLILASARKLKRVLADEQNEALDTLRGRAVVHELDDLVPLDSAHVERYAAAIAAELGAAVTAGATLLDPDARIDVTASMLEPVRELVADGLVRPLRARLERAVADGAGENDQIAKRVRAVYREWKTTHIDDELDDVLRLAHGVGVAAAVPPGTPMCWMVDPDGPACPDAEDNALAGIVPSGEAYPTGHRVAPAHPGCRCLIAPTGN